MDHGKYDKLYEYFYDKDNHLKNWSSKDYIFIFSSWLENKKMEKLWILEY